MWPYKVIDATDRRGKRRQLLVDGETFAEHAESSAFCPSGWSDVVLAGEVFISDPSQILTADTFSSQQRRRK